MAKVKDFSLLDSHLEGTHLIEASAGTGKTYTISGLFLRLVLEKRIPVNEILVVTFTEAATNELKGRIRNRLRQAIQAFLRPRRSTTHPLNISNTSKTDSKDALLNHLVDKHKDAVAALRVLKEAVRSFDQAAIFTIHGFCRRVLHENAFESGSLFDTELVTHQENIKAEIVDDFWRKHFYRTSPLFVSYALGKKFNPAGLLSLLAGRLSQPYLKIIPKVEMPETSQEEKEFKRCFVDLCNAWQPAMAEVEKILEADEGLSRNRYKKANIPVWMQSMDHYVNFGGNNPLLFKSFEKFTVSELDRSVKKGHMPPDHPFFHVCERLKKSQEKLEKVFEHRLLALKTGLFQYAENELTKRKNRKNVQSFDDLLLKVNQALEGKGGDDLVSAIRKRFRAALIDEFQDTDPVQYAIFKKVFGVENKALFLIGDPKQAIYGFRGADVFAYMQASREAESRFTLRENWRSQPDLITAINTIFTNKDRPFVFNEIPFDPAAPADRKYPELLSLNGKSEPPFQLWFLNAEGLTGSDKPVSKARARETIPGVVATEISRLLAHGRKQDALLGKRMLMESDIAVLTRKNSEAHLIQKALSAIHIPSVLYCTDNLFDSHEALEMERVLSAIADPNNEGRIRAAMVTDMIGVKGEELDGLMEDEAGWEKWLVKFKTCHDLWNERGFIRMLRYLQLREKVLPHLMALPNGERRNTNLLHLTEVLHQASVEKKLGIAGLLKWLSEQRDENAQHMEENQLRLESDENAVRIVTVHKSKGLEYPVVFCPFAWDGSRIKGKEDPFTFHDEVDHMRLTLDLGSEDSERNRLFAEKELLAENLRLFYVALTRAKSRCYLIWGRFNHGETAAPAFLFHHQESWKGGDIVSTTGERFKQMSDEDVFAELNALTDKACGTISLSEMPVDRTGAYSPVSLEEATLNFRKFSGKIDRQWCISSFSSLISGMPHGDEMPDRDAIRIVDGHDKTNLKDSIVTKPSHEIFSFAKGARAGTCLHDILEHLDFTDKDPALMKSLVAAKLDEYVFGLEWLDPVCHMITNVLSTPLDPVWKDLRLSGIPNKDRLNELEFYFPLKMLSPSKLKTIFREYSGTRLMDDIPETLERLHFAPTKGFMRGFMDLVFKWRNRFYLVDWKSNFLGDRPEDYCLESLTSAMKNESYILQYTIYTMALDQYLRLRLPGYTYEQDFGGVYYIFLRGVDPDRGPDFGIYRDLPAPEFIKSLRDILIA